MSVSVASTLAQVSTVSPEDRYRWSLYERWCEVQNLQPLRGSGANPSPEMCLLMFLRAHETQRKSSHKTLSHLASAVGLHYEASGLPDPRGEETTIYLQDARRRLGGRRAKPTDAFTWAQVKSFAGTRAGFPLGPRVPWLTATAAVLDLAGLEVAPSDVRLVWSVDRADIDWSEGRISFWVGRSLVEASLDEHPQHYRALQAVLQDCTRTHPFRVVSSKPSKATERLTAALGRAGGQRGEAWLGHIDPYYLNVIQAVAYLMLGALTGHRHAELRRLTVGMIQELPDGYTYTLHQHKGQALSSHRGGRQRPWCVDVPHLRVHSECAAYCPACCLRRHVQQRLLEGARLHDPLFVGHDRQSKLTRATATVWVKQAWEATKDQTSLTTPTCGTRMLRVTAATLGLERGMSIGQIADLLHHKKLRTTMLYVRRLDERAVEEFTLPL